MDDTLFHSGERLVQERTGERATALINGRIIGPHVPEAARAFVGQQRWCVVAAADDKGAGKGAVNASLLTGDAGFAQASDDLASLHFTVDDPHDRLDFIAPFSTWHAGQSVALLFIELQTRRRMRVNGHLAAASRGSFEVAVGQAFPVCPRYIQKRVPVVDEQHGGATTAVAMQPVSGTALDAAASSWITAADTLFIASIGPASDVDVSHRGGRPGFVQVRGQTLRFPDFNGNGMFNTLGNLELDSRCGIVFPDFGGTRQLQLTGHARAMFDVKEDIERTGGTGRWVEFEVDTWRVAPLNRPLAWTFVEASRFNP